LTLVEHNQRHLSSHFMARIDFGEYHGSGDEYFSGPSVHVYISLAA
jgi:hypothetical protein